MSGSRGLKYKVSGMSSSERSRQTLGVRARGEIGMVGVSIGDLIFISSGPHKGYEARVSGFVVDTITGIGPRGPSPTGIGGAKLLAVVARIDNKRIELPPETYVSVLLE